MTGVAESMPGLLGAHLQTQNEFLDAVVEHALGLHLLLRKVRELAHEHAKHTHGPLHGYPECGACVLAELRRILGPAAPAPTELPFTVGVGDG